MWDLKGALEYIRSKKSTPFPYIHSIFKVTNIKTNEVWEDEVEDNSYNYAIIKVDNFEIFCEVEQYTKDYINNDNFYYDFLGLIQLGLFLEMTEFSLCESKEALYLKTELENLIGLQFIPEEIKEKITIEFYETN